jgi:hypothetical protein
MFEFGAGILTGLRTDIAGVQTPRQFGTLQDVAIEFAGDIKELYGSLQFPVDVARGKTKITGKAKLATLQGRFYNDIFFGQTVATGQLKFTVPPGEAFTPGTGSVTYTVAFAGSTPLVDQGVFYTSGTGEQLNASSTASGAGTYLFTATTGVYTFASADIGNPVLLNYTYTVTSGYNIAIGNPFMGTTPRFAVTLKQIFESNQIVLVLNQCVAARLTYPTRIDDYTIQDLDFSAFANAAGSVGSLNVTQ